MTDIEKEEFSLALLQAVQDNTSSVTKKMSTNVPLVKYELVHYREHRTLLTLPWLITYGLSKRFRFEAEVRGYAMQVKLGGGTIEWTVWYIATKYNTGCSVEDAHDVLVTEMSK